MEKAIQEPMNNDLITASDMRAVALWLSLTCNCFVVECPYCHKLVLLESYMEGFWCSNETCHNPKLVWVDAVKNRLGMKQVNYLLGAYKRQIKEVNGILADIEDLSRKAGISLREGLLRSRFRGVLSLMDLKKKGG